MLFIVYLIYFPLLLFAQRQNRSELSQLIGSTFAILPILPSPISPKPTKDRLSSLREVPALTVFQAGADLA